MRRRRSESVRRRRPAIDDHDAGQWFTITHPRAVGHHQTRQRTSSMTAPHEHTHERGRDDERGSTLILAIIIILSLATAMAVLLQQQTGIKAQAAYQSVRNV